MHKFKLVSRVDNSFKGRGAARAKIRPMRYFTRLLACRITLRTRHGAKINASSGKHNFHQELFAYRTTYRSVCHLPLWVVWFSTQWWVSYDHSYRSRVTMKRCGFQVCILACHITLRTRHEAKISASSCQHNFHQELFCLSHNLPVCVSPTWYVFLRLCCASAHTLKRRPMRSALDVFGVYTCVTHYITHQAWSKNKRVVG